ncbi:S41 family peptidase [Candidatus Berkiella aquae]|uniref:Carboxy-terminal processing protease CtpB n=1 Tax=Candidatus Berkiella aquae TaxID=295108 RepID=A0A0Q9Z0X3_9GAMM|nr:S41 family peptidase [Candidatus Berkiella aquae]MCS5712682.1 S41 family peptidase [Candidatus Berkiella aquae]
MSPLINRAPLRALLFVLALQTTVTSLPVLAKEKDDAASNAKVKATIQETLPLDDLQRFTSVVEQIRKYYVKPVNDKELFENAIRGMLSGLDPHSAYLDENEFSDLRANTSGKFGGLGIEVTMEDGFVRVISPIDDTPASRAGLKSGDFIVKLDDTPVKGLTLKKAVEMMRGDRGTNILLTVVRKGTNAPLKIKVTRDIIQVKSIRTKILDKSYGYVRVSQFQTHSGEDLVQAVEKLQKETNNQLKGLIIDLRNNPGGILESSVKVADAFLDKSRLNYNGMIVYTEGRLPGSEIKELATDGDILQGAPVVVIVNGGSASASEIVAGALQDHKRALIVGTQTFGKGSVQTVLPLRDNHGLKLTTALYFTPAGRSIQAKGIVPDIEIPDIKMPEVKHDELEELVNIRESDLDGHLENGAKKPESSPEKEPQASNTTETPSKEAKSESDEGKLALKNDYQLNEALNLLKGLTFIESRQSQKSNSTLNIKNAKEKETVKTPQ